MTSLDNNDNYRFETHFIQATDNYMCVSQIVVCFSFRCWCVDDFKLSTRIIYLMCCVLSIACDRQRSYLIQNHFIFVQFKEADKFYALVKKSKNKKRERETQLITSVISVCLRKNVVLLTSVLKLREYLQIFFICSLQIVN